MSSGGLDSDAVRSIVVQCHGEIARRSYLIIVTLSQCSTAENVGLTFVVTTANIGLETATGGAAKLHGQCARGTHSRVVVTGNVNV